MSSFEKVIRAPHLVNQLIFYFEYPELLKLMKCSPLMAAQCRNSLTFDCKRFLHFIRPFLTPGKEKEFLTVVRKLGNHQTFSRIKREYVQWFCLTGTQDRTKFNRLSILHIAVFLPFEDFLKIVELRKNKEIEEIFRLEPLLYAAVIGGFEILILLKQCGEKFGMDWKQLPVVIRLGKNLDHLKMLKKQMTTELMLKKGAPAPPVA